MNCKRNQRKPGPSRRYKSGKDFFMQKEQHKILSEQVEKEETEFKALLSDAGFSPDCNPARLESLLQEVMAAPYDTA
jgi:hypothetical protein